MPHCARPLTGLALAAVQINGPPRIPLPVTEFHSVSSHLPNFKLVRRKHLPGQSPRLTTEEARVVRWVQRIILQRGIRQPGTEVPSLIFFGFFLKLLERTIVVIRIVQ